MGEEKEKFYFFTFIYFLPFYFFSSKLSRNFLFIFI